MVFGKFWVLIHPQESRKTAAVDSFAMLRHKEHLAARAPQMRIRRPQAKANSTSECVHGQRFESE